MAKLVIDANRKLSKINKEIQGQFSEHLGRCIYEGLYVGENSDIPNVNGMRTDVVEALKNIKVPVLRWPGGCFADEYHWKDGIGPKESRKKMINTNWGGVVEDNSFGTHEFFELCRQIGCETYINGNMGSGTVQEMSEWVEYMTFDGVSPMADLRAENGHEKPWTVDFFGIGNENWGCGGNMNPEILPLCLVLQKAASRSLRLVCHRMVHAAFIIFQCVEYRADISDCQLRRCGRGRGAQICHEIDDRCVGLMADGGCRNNISQNIHPAV